MAFKSVKCTEKAEVTQNLNIKLDLNGGCLILE